MSRKVLFGLGCILGLELSILEIDFNFFSEYPMIFVDAHHSLLLGTGSRIPYKLSILRALRSAPAGQPFTIILQRTVLAAFLV